VSLLYTPSLPPSQVTAAWLAETTAANAHRETRGLYRSAARGEPLEPFSAPRHRASSPPLVRRRRAAEAGGPEPAGRLAGRRQMLAAAGISALPCGAAAADAGVEEAKAALAALHLARTVWLGSPAAAAPRACSRGAR